ncbi:unnamed protein product [Adineta ricciae]|uniref:EGF-like domain-containing protein n=1 Tax=Adineta ricciae TaxID=249248 RepID=A0A815UE68_ADIRI|nr:unnamed protein product [Adineta ricciae]
MLVLLYIIIISNCYTLQPFYNLYNTDTPTNEFDHDCFYSATIENIDLDENSYKIHQIVEYCIRVLPPEGVLYHGQSVSSTLSFDQLKELQVTSKSLIEWSSPIDVVERYEIFLQTNKSSTNEMFYNCTLPWFGPSCQYRFVLNETFTFFIQLRIDQRTKFNKNTKVTCYQHVTCDLGSPLLCLDWREICDGKVDCLDGGEDERFCLELELNECEENEYQCRNGLCVDEGFLSDEETKVHSPECLDGSDEPLFLFSNWCARDPSFKCEDTVCQYSTSFNCGDGNCLVSRVPEGLTECPNKRNRVFGFLASWNNPLDMRYSRCFKMFMCASDMWFTNHFVEYCQNLCDNKQECELQTLKQCPSAFIAPTVPVWDGHFKFGYFSNETSIKLFADSPHFVCYRQDLCPFLISTFTLDNQTCLHTHQLNLSLINNIYEIFQSCTHFSQEDNEHFCRNSTTVRCLGTTKCITKRRVLDGFFDCPNDYDESAAVNSCALNDKHRFQCTSESKCLSPSLVGNRKQYCIGGEDEFKREGTLINIHQLPFSSICNNWIELHLAENETDETQCELWPCVNQYTRCNDRWECPKGIDEVHCQSKSQCPENHHPCFFIENQTLGCLHINYVEDGIMHCFGSLDEQSYCELKYPNDPRMSYRCLNDTKCVDILTVCDDCDRLDDKNHLCSLSTKNFSFSSLYMALIAKRYVYSREPFSHQSLHPYPPIPFVNQSVQPILVKSERRSSLENNYDQRLWLCNKGFVVLVGKNQTQTCLCPESYYGDFCQYQNQRVGLTIRLRQEILNKSHVIDLLVRLVDQTGFVHSYQQIRYIPIILCNTKYNLHLLYHHRLKDMKNNYSIYIDVYNQINLAYLTSWIYELKFPFLPVNRMSVQLKIPVQHDCRVVCSDKYHPLLTNPHHIQTCQCRKAISSYRCDCSSDSICIGSKQNRSICLCPSNKVGPRCYINSVCQMENQCLNGGICLPFNSQESLKNFKCICRDGFFGEYCEKTDVKIEISFSDVKIVESLFIHFLHVLQRSKEWRKTEPVRITIFKKIRFNENRINVNMPLPFHLVFVEFYNAFYLAVLQRNYTPSISISTQVTPSQYCPHIREVFNETILGYSSLHRVKYYHTICRNHVDLNCFHDNYTFLCLCTEERHANCFHFDFRMNYNCMGENICENNGECFQDHPHCPTKIMCVCQECFYGDKCQFTTKHSGLSLDSILGYHIHPHLSLIKQSLPVRIGLICSTVLFLIGFLGGVLSNLTFQFVNNINFDNYILLYEDMDFNSNTNECDNSAIVNFIELYFT